MLPVPPPPAAAVPVRRAVPCRPPQTPAASAIAAVVAAPAADRHLLPHQMAQAVLQLRGCTRMARCCRSRPAVARLFAPRQSGRGWQLAAALRHPAPDAAALLLLWRRRLWAGEAAAPHMGRVGCAWRAAQAPLHPLVYQLPQPVSSDMLSAAHITMIPCRKHTSAMARKTRL